MGENKQRGNTRNPDAGMCFFYDWIDQIKCIRSKAARYELIEAMIEFARSGKNPPEFRDAVSRAVAIGIFKQMERSKTYAKNAKKRVNKGISGDNSNSENSDFADSKADSNADSNADSIAASIADTHNNNNNNNNTLSISGMVGNLYQSKGEAKPNRTEPNEKQVHIPTISEVSDFAHESGFTDMQRVADWFDNNAKKWKWKSVRAGEDWKKLLTAYYMAKYPTWGNAESAADQHEHSFDEAEFLAAALKRSFITDHKEPQQKAAGDDLPF